MQPQGDIVLLRLLLSLFSWAHSHHSLAGQVTVEAWNQLHFARKKWGSNPFVNTPSSSFPNFCHLSIMLSEYAPEEAGLRTCILNTTRCCVCFVWDHAMLSARVCYQWISRLRRGWSWPARLKWFWIIWEILFPHLSFWDFHVCLLAGMRHFAFPLLCQVLVRKLSGPNATGLFLPFFSWSVSRWPEKKDRWRENS